MKIIEALKRLPTIEKRIQKNVALINQYCCGMNLNGNLEIDFDSEDEQRKEVESLSQSVQDLVEERASLRRRLALTNAEVLVKIGDMEKTITEWIELRQRGLDLIIESFRVLRTDAIEHKIRAGNVKIDTDHGFQTIKFYDEKVRNERIEHFENIRDQIDAKLEQVNATTDLVSA